jgi:spermidine synthase
LGHRKANLAQAVIRLSKKYLPGMAIGFKHPKVRVHVGDGFKFLEEYKNEFDVIITDSSDPEGPAESLFQKPYFELLFGALKEGGVISTQGCTFSYVYTQHLVFFCYRFPCLPPVSSTK